MSDPALGTVLDDVEQVLARVPIGSGDLVVTTDRVFAVTPDGHATSRQIPRRAVTSVACSTHLDPTAKHRAGTAGVLGVGSLVGAYLLWGLDLAFPVSQAEADRLGVGEMVGFFASVLDVVSMVDEAFAVLGPVLLLVALGFVWRGRSRTLAFTLDDGEVVRFRAPAADESAEAKIRRALGR